MLMSAVHRGINFRILTFENIRQDIAELISRDQTKKQEAKASGGRKGGRIDVHLADLRQQYYKANISFLIIDSKVSVVEELRDDATNNDRKCRVGHRFATY